MDPTQQVEQLVVEAVEQEAAERAAVLSLGCAAVFAVLGFTSYGFLSSTDPQITLIDNLWPRLLFNSIPWILFGNWLKKSKIKNSLKIRGYFLFSCLMFDIAGSIYVWPLALRGHHEVILYVSQANGAYFFGLLAAFAPPRKHLKFCVISFVLIIFIPLSLVTYLSGNRITFNAIVNDTIFVLATATTIGFFAARLFERLAKFEILKQLEAQKFLGKEVYSAIFQEKRENFEDETKHGYVGFIDIRESTYYTNQHPEQWEAFQKAWSKLSSEIVSKSGGNLLKTGGDSLLITFGLFEETPDLSDLPGIENELQEAEARRWRMLTDSCIQCMEQITLAAHKLGAEYFPEKPIRIGIGVDRGPIKKGLRGSDHRLELDIWGDRVNCASRLEAFCKVVGLGCDPQSSVMVLSPFATDHLRDLVGYVRVPVAENGIKDFPGIRWVLAREFRRNVHATDQRHAA